MFSLLNMVATELLYIGQLPSSHQPLPVPTTVRCGRRTSKVKGKTWYAREYAREYVDICCSWRPKLFGENLMVYLDLFHAVKRISSTVSKKHPLHYECIRKPAYSGHPLGQDKLAVIETWPDYRVQFQQISILWGPGFTGLRYCSWIIQVSLKWVVTIKGVILFGVQSSLYTYNLIF